MATNLAFEAEDSLGPLLDRVEAGEEILITRHGKPAARLIRIPVVSDADRMRALEALDEMDRHAKEMKIGPFDWEEWKAYRDEGRH